MLKRVRFPICLLNPLIIVLEIENCEDSHNEKKNSFKSERNPIWCGQIWTVIHWILVYLIEKNNKFLKVKERRCVLHAKSFVCPYINKWSHNQSSWTELTVVLVPFILSNNSTQFRQFWINCFFFILYAKWYHVRYFKIVKSWKSILCAVSLEM